MIFKSTWFIMVLLGLVASQYYENMNNLPNDSSQETDDSTDELNDGEDGLSQERSVPIARSRSGNGVSGNGGYGGISQSAPVTSVPSYQTSRVTSLPIAAPSGYQSARSRPIAQPPSYTASTVSPITQTSSYGATTAAPITQTTARPVQSYSAGSRAGPITRTAARPIQTVTQAGYNGVRSVASRPVARSRISQAEIRYPY